jgi:hypothetical protein
MKGEGERDDFLFANGQKSLFLKKGGTSFSMDGPRCVLVVFCKVTFARFPDARISMIE